MEAEINVVNGRSFIDYPSSHKRFHGPIMSAVEYYSSLQMTRTVYLITWIYSSLAMPMQTRTGDSRTGAKTLHAVLCIDRSLVSSGRTLPPPWDLRLILDDGQTTSGVRREGVDLGLVTACEIDADIGISFSLFLHCSKIALSQPGLPTPWSLPQTRHG